jgi:hypothetical protein
VLADCERRVFRGALVGGKNTARTERIAEKKHRFEGYLVRAAHMIDKAGLIHERLVMVQTHERRKAEKRGKGLLMPVERMGAEGKMIWREKELLPPILEMAETPVMEGSGIKSKHGCGRATPELLMRSESTVLNKCPAARRAPSAASQSRYGGEQNQSDYEESSRFRFHRTSNIFASPQPVKKALTTVHFKLGARNDQDRPGIERGEIKIVEVSSGRRCGLCLRCTLVAEPTARAAFVAERMSLIERNLVRPRDVIEKARPIDECSPVEKQKNA